MEDDQLPRHKNLPDNVAPNPHSLPYASNIGAPVIRPDHSITGWKHGAVHAANQHYEDRFNDLKKQFDQLAEEFKWNDIMFNAECRIKPIVGQQYHLYKKSNSDQHTHYMSLFAPNERVGGYEHYVGTFRLNYDNRWEKI